MNSPEDEIPLPSKPVLSEEETLRQLRDDSARQYTERIRTLKDQLAAAQAEMKSLKGELEPLKILQKQRDDARDAHARQQANYIQLCEAVLGEGCITSEVHDVVAIAKRHREDSNALNQIRIALKVPYAG